MNELRSNNERPSGPLKKRPYRGRLEENSHLFSMINKRIEVEWDMSDGTREWYSGLLLWHSGDLVIDYDDEEDKVLLDLEDLPEWRPEGTWKETIGKERSALASIPSPQPVFSNSTTPLVKSSKKDSFASLVKNTKTKKNPQECQWKLSLPKITKQEQQGHNVTKSPVFSPFGNIKRESPEMRTTVCKNEERPSWKQRKPLHTNGNRRKKVISHPVKRTKRIYKCHMVVAKRNRLPPAIKK